MEKHRKQMVESNKVIKSDFSIGRYSVSRKKTKKEILNELILIICVIALELKEKF